MKRILNLFLLFILPACAEAEATEIPTIISPKIIPTSTQFLSTFPPPQMPPTITPTIESLCDPFRLDYCITDGHFILQRPIHPPANDLLDQSYLYGSTANGTREPHHGVEFPNPSGTAVYAAASGTVIFAGPDNEAIYAPWPNFYGNLVVIQHEEGLFTLYAHLSKIEVESGQVVGAGTEIGKVGRTGGAIGSHLHFEVRRGDVDDYFAAQDPQLWLLPAKDIDGELFGTLSLSVLDEAHQLVKSIKYTITSSASPSQTAK